jgi:hypothetical protein
MVILATLCVALFTFQAIAQKIIVDKYDKFNKVEILFIDRNKLSLECVNSDVYYTPGLLLKRWRMPSGRKEYVDFEIKKPNSKNIIAS